MILRIQIQAEKKSLYRIDSYDTAKEVNEFCIKNAYRETYKIVVAGYEGEHNNLEDYGYIKYSWKSNGGYRNISGSNDNKFKERLAEGTQVLVIKI